MDNNNNDETPPPPLVLLLRNCICLTNRDMLEHTSTQAIHYLRQRGLEPVVCRELTLAQSRQLLHGQLTEPVYCDGGTARHRCQPKPPLRVHWRVVMGEEDSSSSTLGKPVHSGIRIGKYKRYLAGASPTLIPLLSTPTAVVAAEMRPTRDALAFVKFVCTRVLRVWMPYLDRHGRREVSLPDVCCHSFPTMFDRHESSSSSLARFVLYRHPLAAGGSVRLPFDASALRRIARCLRHCDQEEGAASIDVADALDVECILSRLLAHGDPARTQYALRMRVRQHAACLGTDELLLTQTLADFINQVFVHGGAGVSVHHHREQSSSPDDGSRTFSTLIACVDNESGAECPLEAAASGRAVCWLLREHLQLSRSLRMLLEQRTTTLDTLVLAYDALAPPVQLLCSRVRNELGNNNGGGHHRVRVLLWTSGGARDLLHNALVTQCARVRLVEQACDADLVVVTGAHHLALHEWVVLLRHASGCRLIICGDSDADLVSGCATPPHLLGGGVFRWLVEWGALLLGAGGGGGGSQPLLLTFDTVGENQPLHQLIQMVHTDTTEERMARQARVWLSRQTMAEKDDDRLELKREVRGTDAAPPLVVRHQDDRPFSRQELRGAVQQLRKIRGPHQKLLVYAPSHMALCSGDDNNNDDERTCEEAFVAQLPACTRPVMTGFFQ